MADIAPGDPDVLELAPPQSLKDKLAFGSRRAKRIFDFENYHFQRDRWISFKRIIDWSKCAENPLGYGQLTSAIHAGKFDYNGRSQILFMSPAAIESGLRFDGSVVKILPGCMRFSRSQFRQVHHPKQEQSILEQADLSRFWVPRAVCERWLRNVGYDLLPWIDPPPAPLIDRLPTKPKKKGRPAGTTGKYLLVVEYLGNHFPEKAIPGHASRKALRRDLIDRVPALKGSLDDDTLKKAIDLYNEKCRQNNGASPN